MIKRGPGESDFTSALKTYAKRIGNYAAVEIPVYASESAFLQTLSRHRSRTVPYLVLLDSRGKQFASEQFAELLGKQRDQGQQKIVFAIGPADGWSDDARRQANLLLSLGTMTLPHELARVVLSEQLYRAFTILSGHPYHTGH
ncbi:23S rRNA (pseudouridine(1915)-N(3))-methyltransferase RlmH [Alloacidobacterium dinghuense]|uniref:Ribosomal RNA large subunit methyltransferase H n=1 Tax=Alloacidobacterium dinghuense TaxID=2763107 RepID=A0A7G8BG53_9BACT|nr:23S rRNA (pseudouridine(1915)-N(3))-methyltransferase RlmH [Alloacidobacterium dinghuense]QNI31523.1 23S rRNA (pseudouridine(1915)-N(3))-methyltransferase RlmH [Alloacidobacterium dinghuense]